MAIYRTGQASMDAQGYITGYDTKWREQLTLIRPGATIVFLTQPLQIAVITEVINDTSIRAITTGGAVVARSNYAILLHDSITVDGLAQDVAETLRYYQSKETEIADALEFFKTFDWKHYQDLAKQVEENAASANQSKDAAKNYQDAALASQNAAKTSETNAKNSEIAANTSKSEAARSASDALASKNAAKASEDKAKEYADSINPANMLNKNNNLSDVADKGEARKNLEIPYSGFENMVIVNAPSGAVDGKYYPIIIKMPTDDLRYLGSEVAIQTRSGIAADPMNSCTFTGYIRSSGASDRKQCVYGMFSQYDGAEKAIHSVLMSGTSDENGYTAFYVEKRAFPIKIRVAQRCEIIVPTEDFSFSDVTFKWGASNPASESANASEMLRFTTSGFHSSNAMYTKTHCTVETSSAGYVIRGTSGDTSQALYYMAQDANQRRLFYIGKSGNNQDVLINNDMKSSYVSISDDIKLRTPSYNGAIFADASSLNIRSANNRLFRFENTNNAAKDATIQLFGASSRPTVVECKLPDGYLWYAQQNTDGSRIFQVNGAVSCVSVNQSSDRDLKDNIKEIPNATESIRKMSGYTYTLKENGLPYAGVIAQEVMEAIPEAVSGFTQHTVLAGPTKDGNQLVGEERFLSVDYSAVTGLLVKVCRESDDRISKLENEVAELKAAVSALINKPTTLKS